MNKDELASLEATNSELLPANLHLKDKISSLEASLLSISLLSFF